jgi:hypothetical protein
LAGLWGGASRVLGLALWGLALGRGLALLGRLTLGRGLALRGRLTLLGLTLRRRLAPGRRLPLRWGLALVGRLALGRRLLWRRRLSLALPAALATALAVAFALASTAPSAATPTPSAAAAALGRLAERGNLALHEVAVVFAVGVIGAELQCRVVRFDRVGPFLYGVLGGGFFDLLAGAIECVAEVVVGVLLI